MLASSNLIDPGCRRFRPNRTIIQIRFSISAVTFSKTFYAVVASNKISKNALALVDSYLVDHVFGMKQSKRTI